MKILPCEQGTVEWFMAKRGIPSASCFDRILTPKTMKLSAAADDYICELIGDLFDPEYPRIDEAITKPMRRGIEGEPEARRFYEMEANTTVHKIGFVTTDDGRFGCSPDGLIDGDGSWLGGLELKRPTHKVHVRWLLEGTLPDEHKVQVHGSLAVSGLPWWDFLSYCDRLDPLLVRVTPDDFTKELRVALELFWDRFQAAKARIAA